MPASTVRLVATAYRHEPRRVASLGAFRASLERLFDDDVAPLVADDHPTLVVLPEHLGLTAAAIGPRGEAAREQLGSGASPADALIALMAPWADAIDHYHARFPEVGSPGQLLLLALTDPLVRAVVDTGAALARRHGVYLVTSAAIAAHRRGAPEPELARALREPSAHGDVVYEATGPAVRNRAYWFDPAGELVGVTDKAYLVPFERDCTAGLGLAPCELDEITVVDLPFGAGAGVISKDAWMPDVADRLDELGATLLAQPEAFDRWGAPGDDLWAPDKLQRSGWLLAQTQPGIAGVVASMLTGNLGGEMFDGQPFVASPGPGRARGLLGQVPSRGWAAVGPWDAREETPDELCDAERRAEFAAHAARLAPSSGTDAENAYAEAAVAADVVVTACAASPAGAPPAASPEADSAASPAISPSTSPGAAPSISLRGTPQPSSPLAAGDARGLRPALAWAGQHLWCAWVELAGGTRRVAAATSPEGRAWSPTPSPAASPAEAGQLARVWAPTVAALDDTRVLAAWLDFRDESWDVYGTVGDGAGWSAPQRLDDADTIAGTSRERGHRDLTSLPGSDGVVLAWSDVRFPWVNPQARWSGITVSSSPDPAALRASPSARIDGGPTDAIETDPLGLPSPHETRAQRFPRLAATTDGIVAVWQEPDEAGVAAVWCAPLTGRPRVTGRVRVAGGAPGTAAGGLTPVDALCRAAWRPTLLAIGDELWVAWEQPTNEGGRALWARRSPDAGRTWDEAVRVDATAPAWARQRGAVLVDVPGGPAAVFTDDRGGADRVVATRLDADHPPDRVDDAPEGGAARTASAAATPTGEVVVVWQDTRGGREHVRAGRWQG